MLRSARPAATNQPGAMASARAGLGVAPAGPRVGQGAFTQCALLSGGGGPARRCPRARHDEGQPFFAGLWRASPPPPCRWGPASRAFVFGGWWGRAANGAGWSSRAPYSGFKLAGRGLPGQVLRQSAGLVNCKARARRVLRSGFSPEPARAGKRRSARPQVGRATA